MLHNLFTKNYLLAQLSKLLEMLDDFEDREIIVEMIKKHLPKQSKYNFTINETCSLSKKEISTHSKGVQKCMNYAREFISNLYCISLYDVDDCCGYDMHENGLYYEIRKMKYDFQITRCLIYKKTPIELLKESANTFDLYITQLFIQEYDKIVKNKNTINNNQ